MKQGLRDFRSCAASDPSPSLRVSSFQDVPCWFGLDDSDMVLLKKA